MQFHFLVDSKKKNLASERVHYKKDQSTVCKEQLPFPLCTGAREEQTLRVSFNHIVVYTLIVRSVLISNSEIH